MILTVGKSAALVCGGTMNRARPARFLVFISIWSVIVYEPVARWSWDPDGWSNKLGVMDFAGGTAVHIVSGTTVAAFAVFCAIERLGSFQDLCEAVKNTSEKFFKRLVKGIVYPWLEIWRTLVALGFPSCFKKGDEDEDSHSGSQREPSGGLAPIETYNVNYMVLGTALLWFGWAGFNGGSALGGNMRAVSAWTSTHIAACAGGTCGVFFIWYKKIKIWLYTGGVGHDPGFEYLTVVYFCDGAIAGLVAITPGAGYVSLSSYASRISPVSTSFTNLSQVPVWSAAIFGAISAVFVLWLKKETAMFLKEDPLQIFTVHTGGGFIGMLLTGLLARCVNLYPKKVSNSDMFEFSDTTIGLDGYSTMPHPEYTRGQRFG
jgi:Amt family ammonium transporter